MGIGKIIGINILIFALLNIIFSIIFAAVGGVGVSIGQFFGLILNDGGAYFTSVFTLGGTGPDVVSSLWNYIGALLAGPSIAQPVVGMLWVLLPGSLAAIITGKKYGNESSKDAFWGIFLSFMILAALPLIIAAIPIFGIYSETLISQNMVAPIYFTNGPGGIALYSLGSYFVPLVIGIFNAIFFAGIAAASSSDL
ncbi:MAG: hypothetical protein ACTSWW_03505 [Promethearchaeota archaeon]